MPSPPAERVQVLVVGFGAAGAAAAITARDLGASVVVLEKQPEHAHTPSTRMSGGMIMGVTDVDAAAAYLDGCAGGMIPYAVSHAWADRARHLLDWLGSVAPGLALTSVGVGEQHDVAGVDAIDVLQPGTSASRLDASSGAGPTLFAALRDAALRRGAVVRWGQPAHRLRRAANGAVTGVVLGSGEVVAADSVILTCGGYEFDESMKRDYLRAYPIYFYGNPGNTGDGVRMAQDVGADLWHMNQMIGRAIGHFTLPDGTPMGFIITIGPP
jgi:succinate dehydrogenase/fumarate reductase flavoprotein subunit